MNSLHSPDYQHSLCMHWAAATGLAASCIQKLLVKSNLKYLASTEQPNLCNKYIFGKLKQIEFGGGKGHIIVEIPLEPSLSKSIRLKIFLINIIHPFV